jgi:hypothetical protein
MRARAEQRRRIFSCSDSRVRGLTSALAEEDPMPVPRPSTGWCLPGGVALILGLGALTNAGGASRRAGSD